jgi:catechol 2,3-dioxygenase-like lactoylglutathione lyase family enzyme
MLKGLNHITLAVNDLNESFTFYSNLLGFKPHAKWRRGAYLSLGDLWLCLSCDQAVPSQDYSHIAFDIASKDFSDFSQHLTEADIKQWKINSSEGESLYIFDPNGHKLEIHVGDLGSRLKSLRLEPYDGLVFFSESGF